MTPPVDDGRCFACGPFNADGLHLRFRADGDDAVRATITLPPRFQGWRDIAHGGIVMTLLDEGMAHACGQAGQRGVTASMNLRFRRPVPLGRELAVTGRVTGRRGTILMLEARVALAEDDTTLAEATGSFASQGEVKPGTLGRRF